MEKRTLGSFMKAARERRTKLKQKDLARLCKLGKGGQGTVSSWENDKQPPSVRHIETLLKAAGLTLGDCLYFPDEVSKYRAIEIALENDENGGGGRNGGRGKRRDHG